MLLFVVNVEAFAAYNTVPTKMFPKMTGVEIVTGANPDMEMHIKFSNNVSAIDETQERNAVNAPDPNYMIGVNERNLTKFHLVKKENGETVEFRVTPHPNAKKQTDESKYFYIYANGLDPDIDYQVIVDEDLYANMGNSLGVSYIINFNLNAGKCNFAPDGEMPEDEHVQAPLTLDMINLENNQKNVPTTVNLIMRFSYNVAGKEVFDFNSSMMSLVKASDASVNIPVTVKAGGEVQELVLRPNNELEPGTEYRFIIKKDFVARNGISLSSPINLYFTTAGDAPLPPNNNGGGNAGNSSGVSNSEEPKNNDINFVSFNEHIKISTVGKGKIKFSKENINVGDFITMTPEAEDGYVFKSLSVKDEKGVELALKKTSGKDNIYSFTMPEGNIEIQLIFEKKENKNVNFNENKYESKYSDIENSWAKDDINKLSSIGIISGDPGGTFRPNAYITRAEAASILVRLYDIDIESEKQLEFADMKGHWASWYVSAAASKGIVKGYDSKRFGPNDLLTREQLTVMMNRVEVFNTGNTEVSELKFKDKAEISAWAVDSIKAAFSVGIISGYEDGSFMPKKNITRAETCHMIANLLKMKEEK